MQGVKKSKPINKPIPIGHLGQDFRYPGLHSPDPRFVAQPFRAPALAALSRVTARRSSVMNDLQK